MGTIRLSTSTTSPHLLTRPTNKSKKKYQFCILYLKEEVPIMYLLSLWFYWPDPPTRQRRSINFVFYISLILLPRPTHKSRKGKIRICRICGHASFWCIYLFVSWWLFWVQYLALSASFVGASICVQWSDFEWFSIRGQSVQGQGSPDANHVHQIISYSLFASPFYLHFVQTLTVSQ